MPMVKPVKIITAAEMDRMTPQERADAVDASIMRSWDDVSPAFRAEIMATAKMLGEQRRRQSR
jgi:hypothetical protein